MDPITLILTALAAGAAASIKDTTSEAVKDTYNGLKALVKNKFTNKPKAETALVEYEDDPETYEKPLKKALVQEQVDQDIEIIEAAKKLMAQVNPQQAAMGKYNVQITGNVQGYAQGDYQQVTMNFGNEPKEK
jgi:disulfide oxidoreductase YuzD